jgi:hypothetical protein
VTDIAPGADQGSSADECTIFNHGMRLNAHGLSQIGSGVNYCSRMNARREFG